MRVTKDETSDASKTIDKAHPDGHVEERKSREGGGEEMYRMIVRTLRDDNSIKS
jgi:hypothetical protein